MDARPELLLLEFRMSAQNHAAFSDPSAATTAPCAQPAPSGPARDANGKFTGAGAYSTGAPGTGVAFDDVETSRTLLVSFMDDVVGRYAAHGDIPDCGKPPVTVVQASAGSGKSRALREAAVKHQDRLNGDMIYFAPTLALAEEAAAHARSLGGDAYTLRGRSAADPTNPSERMCQKHDLAERLGRLGAAVGPSICRFNDERTGVMHVCEHFQSCAYQRQFETLPDTPAQLYVTHASLNLDRPKDREVAFRVIDEAFWRTQVRPSTISVAEFTAKRMSRRVPAGGVKAPSARPSSWTIEQAARVVAANLRFGRSVLAGGLSKAPLEMFAAIDAEGFDDRIVGMPSMSRVEVETAIKAAESERRLGWRRQRIWRLLADAVKLGRDFSDQIRLRVDGQGVEMIDVFCSEEIPQDRPLIILDADADDHILREMCPPDESLKIRLRPNAAVFQVHDRTMSRAALSASRAMRDDWTAIIRREVLIDAAGPKGGVLVGATRKVVKMFFEDAGHDFGGMEEDDVSRFMLETPLHGARWLWFGGRALGSNAWRDCSCVVVIGREELPIEVLEDQGRCVFGDRGSSRLGFIRPDAEGQVQMPEVELHYTMADGSGWAVKARAHPDERIRALQMQSREWATLQLIERLRLAHAPYRKRVIIGCKIPIPGFPVDHLVPWSELKPTRAERALLEGIERGGLRLSHGGLAADAPTTFAVAEETREKNRKAGADLVKKWRKGLPGPAMGVGASFNALMSGSSPLAAHLVHIRIGTSPITIAALVFPRGRETVAAAAARAWPNFRTMEDRGCRFGISGALIAIARGMVGTQHLVGDDPSDPALWRQAA